MLQEIINGFYHINQWIWIIVDVITVVIGIGSFIYKIYNDDSLEKTVIYIPIIAILTFLASQSQQMVIVPDLLGLPYGEAGDILVHNDLRYEKMDTQNGEYVIRQEIEAGNVVEKHTMIKLELGEMDGESLVEGNPITSVPTDIPDSGDAKEAVTEPEATAAPTPTATPEPTPEPSPTPEPVPEPVSIRKMSEFYSDGIEHRKDSITDNVGNTYEGFSYMSAGDFWVNLDGSAVYRNDGEYKRLYGKVIISQNEKDEEECGWIKI